MYILGHLLIPASIGTQRELYSYNFGKRGASPKVYIQASLHADELPGMLVAFHLREQLESLETLNLILGEIILVPVANPIGLAQSVMGSHLGRYDLSTSENFNSNFYDFAPKICNGLESLLTDDEVKNTHIIRKAMEEEHGKDIPRTELESLRHTITGLSYDADIVLDLHCDWEAVPHLYTGTPVWEKVEPLARYFGTQVNLLSLKSGNNPFDDASGQTWWKLREHFKGRFPIGHGTVAVTLEHRGQCDVSHKLAKEDAKAILDYLTYAKVIYEGIQPLPLGSPTTNLAEVEHVRANFSGIIVYRAELGSIVVDGQVIADIVHPITGNTEKVRCTQNGVFYARNHQRFATTGMSIARISKEAAE